MDKGILTSKNVRSNVPSVSVYTRFIFSLFLNPRLTQQVNFNPFSSFQAFFYPADLIQKFLIA